MNLDEIKEKAKVIIESRQKSLEDPFLTFILEEPILALDLSNMILKLCAALELAIKQRDGYLSCITTCDLYGYVEIKETCDKEIEELLK